MRSCRPISQQDVEEVGTAGSFARVNHGFARNYLIPQRKAVICHEATQEQLASGGGGGGAAVAAAAEAEAAAPTGLAERQLQAEAAVRKLAGGAVTIKRKTADGQALDFPVGKDDIAQAVGKQVRRRTWWWTRRAPRPGCAGGGRLPRQRRRLVAAAAAAGMGVLAPHHAALPPSPPPPCSCA